MRLMFSFLWISFVLFFSCNREVSDPTITYNRVDYKVNQSGIILCLQERVYTSYIYHDGEDFPIRDKVEDFLLVYNNVGQLMNSILIGQRGGDTHPFYGAYAISGVSNEKALITSLYNPEYVLSYDINSGLLDSLEITHDTGSIVINESDNTYLTTINKYVTRYNFIEKTKTPLFPGFCMYKQSKLNESQLFYNVDWGDSKDVGLGKFRFGWYDNDNYNDLSTSSDLEYVEYARPLFDLQETPDGKLLLDGKLFVRRNDSLIEEASTNPYFIGEVYSDSQFCSFQNDTFIIYNNQPPYEISKKMYLDSLFFDEAE